MALSGFGTPSQYGTANMIQRLMTNPLNQQAIANAANIGQDKKAVGGISRSLGSLIAAEQGKMLQTAQIGEQLSRRKDKLNFQKKVAKQELANANKVMDYETGQSNIAFGLGLASVGVNLKSNMNSKEYRKKERELIEAQLAFYNRSGLVTRQEDEDIVNWGRSYQTK